MVNNECVIFLFELCIVKGRVLRADNEIRCVMNIIIQYVYTPLSTDTQSVYIYLSISIYLLINYKKCVPLRASCRRLLLIKLKWTIVGNGTPVY